MLLPHPPKSDCKLVVGGDLWVEVCTAGAGAGSGVPQASFEPQASMLLNPENALLV